MVDKKISFAIVIILVTVSISILPTPFKAFFNEYLNSIEESKLLSTIVKRFCLFILLIFAIDRLGLKSFAGINRKPYVKNKSVLAIPALLICAGVWGNWTTYIEAGNTLLILFLVSSILVGLVEETCFRGIVLPLTISSFKNRSNSLLIGLIITAFLFGILHFFNLFSNPDNLYGVTTQSIYGFAIGVFFGALMLRTGSIFIVSLCHAFTNIILGHGIIKEKNNINDIPTPGLGLDIIDIIGNVLVVVFITWIGINMVKLVDQKTILKELESVKI